MILQKNTDWVINESSERDPVQVWKRLKLFVTLFIPPYLAVMRTDKKFFLEYPVVLSSVHF